MDQRRGGGEAGRDVTAETSLAAALSVCVSDLFAAFFSPFPRADAGWVGDSAAHAAACRAGQILLELVMGVGYTGNHHNVHHHHYTRAGRPSGTRSGRGIIPYEMFRFSTAISGRTRVRLGFVHLHRFLASRTCKKINVNEYK